MLEAGSEEEAQRTAATVPHTALAVPASLHASLMARLDRLGPAKEVGADWRSDWARVLLCPLVRGRDKARAGSGASALSTVDRGWLAIRQGVLPHAGFLFKHALVQDAAYGSLLREHRRTLYARITQALESYFPDIADSQPELRGTHLHRSWSD